MRSVVIASALMRAASAFPVMTTQQQQQLLRLSSTTSGKSEFARHLHSPMTAPAWQVVADALGPQHCSEQKARELITFGAVYAMAAGDVKARRLPDSNMIITEKQYMRVHPNPRRFPVCNTTDWESTICYENQHMLLINKPAATPSHSTVDNLYENVSACVQAIRPNDVIQAAHRLDIATSGFIVLSKHAAFVAAFMQLQASGSRAKRYTALVMVRNGSTGLQQGVLTHYMMPSKRAPKIFSTLQHDSTWQKCELIVLSARFVQPQLISKTDTTATTTTSAELHLGKAAAEVNTVRLQEVEVQLITGRTHQIRGQFSAVDCPIVGDTLYYNKAVVNDGGQSPSAYVCSDKLALQSSSIDFTLPTTMGGDYVHRKLTSAWWSQYITTDTNSDNTVADSKYLMSNSFDA
jgi:23S rRNA-/tRNA-specific pseudouridylate synthase